MWKHHGCRYFVHERTMGMPVGREQGRPSEVEASPGVRRGSFQDCWGPWPRQATPVFRAERLLLALPGNVSVDPCCFQLLLLTQNLILLPE